MKACVLHAIGDLRCESVKAPTLREGEVLVRVGACGVCGSDIPRIFVKGTYRFPTIPGHELAGVVTEVGVDAPKTLLGSRVAIFPLIPCKECPACEVGEYAQCAHYNYLGSRCDGGFAEFVRVPEWNLVPIPENVSLEEAAMTEPAAVAIHALRQAGIDIGDTVVVFGAGPIGLILGLWARAWGAGRVLLVDIDDRKLDFAHGLGFELTLNAKDRDPIAWISSLTELGVDIAIEASGSSNAFNHCVQVVRPFGNVVLMGNPEGEMRLSQDAYWAILRKELSLHGTWNSTYSTIPRNEWRLALEFMASKRLDLRPLITRRVGLDGLLDAIIAMRDQSEFTSKVMYVDDGQAP